MSITVLTISSYFYLISTLLLPQQMIMLTSQLLSLITTLPEEDSFITISHVSKCFLLLLRFIVLFIILFGKALYSLTAKNRDTGPTNKNLTLTPTMQPNASLTFESTTQNGTEPITVPPASSKIQPAKLKKQTISNHLPVVPILGQDKTTIQNPSVSDRQKALHVTPLHVNEPIVSAITNAFRKSPDHSMVQESDLEEPSLSVAVTPSDSGNNKEPNSVIVPTLNKKDQLTEPVINHDQAPPLLATEPLPSLKSDNSSSTKQSSDVSKEPYDADTIKKESNLMALPENTQQLFDELTTTPVPSDVPSRFYRHERTSSAQPSMEETVPGLSPHPSSTVSRKSSIASQRSGLKGVFQTTLSKMSRKNSVRERPSQQPPLPEQQQQTMMLDAHDPVPSATTSTKRLSKLSTFKLGRKKSVTSIHAKQQQLPVDDAPKKRSFSMNMKNKLKSIVHKKT